MIPKRAIGATRSPGTAAKRSRTLPGMAGEVRERPARPAWPRQGWQRPTICLALQGHDHRPARPDLAASALHHADSAPALRPLHAGDRFPGVRLQAGRVWCASRNYSAPIPDASELLALPTRWAGTQHTTGVQIIRTARHLAIVARKHGPARRRHYGPARPLYHPGRDRHLDFVRLTSRLSAATCCTRPPQNEDLRSYIEYGEMPHRLLGELQQIHCQPAEGMVRRRSPPRRTTSGSPVYRAWTTTTRNWPTSIAWQRVG